MTSEENMEYKSGNVFGVDLTKSLFRVYSSTDWFIQAVREQAITLVKPERWDDPFENFILRSSAKMKNGQTVHFSEIGKLLYGLCWTLNSDETDALWRIYSPNKVGVRVKVKADKLFSSFYNLNDPFATVSYFIGKVEYKTESELKTIFEDPDNLNRFIFDSSTKGHIRTLLYKRTEFSHENEVRLVYQADKERYHPANPLYVFGFNPNDLFEEVLFDPRMTDVEFRKYENELLELGFPNSIKKSKLYSLPKLNLQLNI